MITTTAAENAGEAQIQLAEAAQPDPGLDESGELVEMFAGIAAGYVRPVRQFLTRLRAGPTSGDWIEISLPAVSMVARSARTMGLQSMGATLGAFENLLKKASEKQARVIEGELRASILLAYQDLAEAVPAAFACEDDDQKDGVILHLLLRQVPDVGTVSVDKIFGAGLTSVEMLERARPRDIALTTGIPLRLSERICQALDDYRAESRARLSWTSPGDWAGVLSPVVTGIEEHHREFDRLEGADDRPEAAADRRKHRRGRQESALRVDMLLAEMGEVHLVDELQRLSFERRIARLRDFLGSLNGAQKPFDLAGLAAEDLRGVAGHG